jgi:putative ABC transport system permease protein
LSVGDTDAALNGEEIDVSLWGIDPGGPGTPSDVEEGRVPEEGEALVDALARDAGMTIGTTVDVANVTLEVVGVARNATYSVSPTLYVTNETWAEVFLSAYPDAQEAPVNLVAAAVDDGTDPDDVASAISDLEGLQGLTPAEAASATPGVSSIEQSFGLITGITFVIVIVVVGFFFQILTVQKLRVFALLEALGSGIRSLAAYVLGQIGVVVTLGVVVGLALLGITARATRETFAIAIDPSLTVTLGGTILLASLASGITSIRRIAKQDVSRVATGGSQ